MIAHVGGLPVEEVLPLLMSGGGAWFLLRLTSLGARLRPTRAPIAGPSGGDVLRREPDLASRAPASPPGHPE